ncbi:hypothetical protein [Halostella salina]|uniref:hypothetical protein n=1 Tax=Halostella salina TaxID=1547897 RepID=UPI000EF833D7|nr:hypothetical protein [Halostella salina]
MADDPAVKEQVKQILLNHKGEDNPISSREINEEIGVDDIGSFPSTRAIIRELVMDDYLPVAASTKGYFVIQDEDELEDYIDQLENRVMNITERKFAVQRAVLEWDEEIVDEDSDLL